MEVKIISFNGDNERVCASAARISTTKGDSLEIFNDAIDPQKNRKLIHKVLQSGHQSFIEHAVFTLALCDVSVIVEQFFIEFRLASFTVKSRRYVDFGSMGYYIPPDLSEECRLEYMKHMADLFGEYRYFVDSNIPKEDARFVLPYSFYSNFYCTVNARELIHILKAILYGRGMFYKELQTVAQQIIRQLEELCPSILIELQDSETGGSNVYPGKHHLQLFGTENLLDNPDIVGINCELIHCDVNREAIILAHCLHSGDCADENSDVEAILGTILQSKRPRELETVAATFCLRNISLAGITHVARHRMQSLIVPPIRSVKPKRYMIPPSIHERPELNRRYHGIFHRNAAVIHSLRQKNFPEESYLALSGNTLDVLTTMNARELMLFFALRTCNRAQWEIREAATNMLRQLRGIFPELFNKMGPACFVKGRCPENTFTCGRQKEVRLQFMDH